MKKNDIIPLAITDLQTDGSGIGRAPDGMAVFVPLSAPLDRLNVKIVKIKKSYAYGIIDSIVTPSPARITPDCASFSKCGGCSLRHISYEKECEIKENRVNEVCKRIGKVSFSSKPVIAAESTLRYRNKAQYPFSPDGKVGFFAPHSHRIIPADDCLLQPAEFTTAARVVEQWIKAFGISIYSEDTKKGLLRHLYLRKAEATSEIMLVLVINGSSVPHSEALISALKTALGDSLKSIQVNINRRDTNVILGDECRVLYGDSFITDILCGIKVRLSPLSFYQVNRTMAERLYLKAAEYACPDGKTVLDLYCGTGTIGLSMAKRAKRLVGVEIIPQAVADAETNARENGIENAKFICADAAKAAKKLASEKLKPDVVIIDPPRKGCSEELITTITRDFSPERVVYISCDPATLARDIAVFSSLGYSLKEYTPVDLFPRTNHVETAALFLHDINS